MRTSWEFGRKISYRPLIVSALLGAVAALVAIPLFKNVNELYSLLTGVLAFLVISMESFPRHLSMQYGFWQITEQGVVYYNYDNYLKRVKAVFFPRSVQKVDVKFSNIKKVIVINGPKIIQSKKIWAVFYAPELYLPWLRTQRYLELTLTNGEQVKLDLSWDDMYKKGSHESNENILDYVKTQMEN